MQNSIFAIFHVFLIPFPHMTRKEFFYRFMSLNNHQYSIQSLNLLLKRIIPNDRYIYIYIY